MPGEVALRPLTAADEELVLSVYASTRADELAPLGWPPEQLDAFIRMQFDAQSRSYAAGFPDSERSIVVVGGEPAGRVIVDRNHVEIRIVELSLLPGFRRAGVGTTLMTPVLKEADRAGLPLRCHVAEGNPARSFWERLGFVAGESDGAYVAMERPCST